MVMHCTNPYNNDQFEYNIIMHKECKYFSTRTLFLYVCVYIYYNYYYFIAFTKMVHALIQTRWTKKNDKTKLVITHDHFEHVKITRDRECLLKVLRILS